MAQCIHICIGAFSWFTPASGWEISAPLFCLLFLLLFFGWVSGLRFVMMLLWVAFIVLLAFLDVIVFCSEILRGPFFAHGDLLFYD
jgi:hypothetical protein